MALQLREPAPPRRPTNPPALHERALQDLSFIRRTMEGASAFTDVPGWGLVGMGVTAIGASSLAAAQPSAGRWISVWIAEACVGGLLGIGMMWRKMRARAPQPDAPLLSIPARKFLFGFWPAILAGAILTAALIDPALVWRDGSTVPRILPGLWMLLYGVGVITAGAFSVRAVPLMGAGFMAFGSLSLLVSSLSPNLILAAAFGVWQIGFGFWNARRHGG